MSQTDEIWWADEMRVGMRRPVRRVWASRGTRVCQPVTLGYAWRWLTVALHPRTGPLRGPWHRSLRGKVLAYIWRRGAQTPEVDGLVGDGAGGHQGQAMQAVDLPRIVQPPYAPALNPVERFFAELRRAIEGRLYPDLEAKQKAVTAVLRLWREDPDRVRQLCGWTWITGSVTQLPTCQPEIV